MAGVDSGAVAAAGLCVGVHALVREAHIGPTADVVRPSAAA
jgi:hypothetical protein